MSNRQKSQRAFTLIELIIVVLIIGILLTLVGIRLGSFTYWKEEAFIRRLSEVIVFLHEQAVVDQEYYRMEFDLKNHEYRVGVIKPSVDASAQFTQIAQQAGNLSLELAAFLSPAIGQSQDVIPPPSFPSLADPTILPEGVTFQEIRTVRGTVVADSKEVKPYILFSPRGFSEFGVIHITLSSGAPITILINPFTGLTEVFRENRDFEWNYGKKKKKR